jgi:hypothetical protein
MSTEETLIILVVAVIVNSLVGYFIYGWWSHRTFRDNHLKVMQAEALKQTMYLKVLAETLAKDKLAELREQIAKENGGSKEWPKYD